MKKHYSDYVTHCLRFYSRHPKPKYYKTNVDKTDWLAVDKAMKLFSQEEREILLMIYREADTIADNVYSISKKTGTSQNSIWGMLKRLEYEVAKKRGLAE